MDFYKGYVKTDGKKPLDKFKNGSKLRTLEEVQNCESYAGVLADNMILIDVDDAEQAEILMNMVEDFQLDCIVHQTTKGKHFLFKNSGVEQCGTGKHLACGLTADIKVGKHNSTQQLKLNGEERFIEWDCNEPEPLPKWLYPVNSKVDFFNMEEGEGRNSSLFAYILTLTGNGFSKEESRKTIEILNRYVLKTPLSENEIDTITRDEAFPKETFYDGKSFLHNNFALFLKNNNHIKRINGQLHVYKDGCYIPGYDAIEREMFKLLPTLRDRQRKETLLCLKLMIEESTERNPEYICFRNGIYNIETGQLQDFSPDVVLTNKIPWDYVPDAYSEIADKCLNEWSCGDASIRSLLEEMMGYCLYGNNKLQTMFILTGEKSNGKSTFLDMLRYILGDKNCTSMDLSNMCDKFKTAALYGKLVNIGDDIADGYIDGDKTAIIKKIVTGERLTVENKGRDPFDFTPYTKLIFSANDIPRTRDRSDALLRRFKIIPFNADFSNKPKISLRQSLETEENATAFLKYAVDGLRRLLSNEHFTLSESVNKALDEYRNENNPVQAFINDRDLNAEKLTREPFEQIYAEFKYYCTENGYQPITNIAFSKQIRRKYNLESKRIKTIGGTKMFFRSVNQ